LRLPCFIDSQIKSSRDIIEKEGRVADRLEFGRQREFFRLRNGPHICVLESFLLCFVERFVSAVLFSLESGLAFVFVVKRPVS
jgi:hypothetical protein